MLNKVKNSLYEKTNSLSLTGILINAVLIILALILAGEIIFNMCYTGIYVVNISMTPTLKGATVLGYDANGRAIAGTDGDYVYIKTGAKPDYGDIVVVYRPSEGDNIIKRAVAKENDEVWFEDGWLYLNGEKQEEPYISDEYRTSPECEYYNFPHHVVGEGCVFLLGDNRNHSDDSRKHGDYKLENIIGVVPEWSVRCKKFSTAMHAFFYFKLRGRRTAEISDENALFTA